MFTNANFHKLKDAINTGKSKTSRTFITEKIMLWNIKDTPNSSTREIASKSSYFYMGNIKGNWIISLLLTESARVNSGGLFMKIIISFTKKI